MNKELKKDIKAKAWGFLTSVTNTRKRDWRVRRFDEVGDEIEFETTLPAASIDATAQTIISSISDKFGQPIVKNTHDGYSKRTWVIDDGQIFVIQDRYQDGEKTLFFRLRDRG